MNARERLLALDADNTRAAIFMMEQAPRFDEIRGARPRAVSAFNLFQTPPDIAARMVAMLPAGESLRILEPSAGLGRLYKALYNRYGSAAQVHLVEQSADCCRELYEQNIPARLYQADFLTWYTSERFDCIVMNPPFKRGRDVQHIKKAIELLTPGGVLVALCYNGVRQNTILRPLADYWQQLPAGSFRSEGTSAGVVLLKMQKGVDKPTAMNYNSTAGDKNHLKRERSSWTRSN